MTVVHQRRETVAPWKEARLTLLIEAMNTRTLVESKWEPHFAIKKWWAMLFSSSKLSK